MKVTVKDLTDYHCCPSQVALFEKTYPNGVVLSRGILLEALKKDLDVDYFMCNVLQDAEFERETADIIDKYNTSTFTSKTMLNRWADEDLDAYLDLAVEAIERNEARWKDAGNE